MTTNLYWKPHKSEIERAPGHLNDTKLCNKNELIAPRQCGSCSYRRKDGVHRVERYEYQLRTSGAVKKCFCARVVENIEWLS